MIVLVFIGYWPSLEDINRRSDKRRHPMTPEDQSLVRDSFAKVEPITPQAAAMFYDRLFVLDPSLKPLFKSDMNEQGRMLMAMIGTVVANLVPYDLNVCTL